MENHVAARIQSMLEAAEPFFPAECCIYRVPHELRKLNHEAHSPKVVSIGPFHNGDSRLQKMEGHKQVYCRKFLQRFGTEDSLLHKLVQHVQEMEPKVRRSYSDEINLDKEKFVVVILIDCCFILELFVRHNNDEWEVENDSVSSTRSLQRDIAMDLLLLENQIPFFILEQVYNFAFPSRLNGEYPSFFMLSIKYFNDTITGLGFGLDFPCNGGITVAHFTDLVRALYLQPSNPLPPRTTDFYISQRYSAIELNEAGVKFRVNATKSNFLDLDLSGRILAIPQINVDDFAECMLRNIVALEQYLYPEQSYFSDYIVFLDFVIKTAKDVDFLANEGILVNWLGDSNAVADLIKGMAKNISLTNLSAKYIRIGEELMAFGRHSLYVRMFKLRKQLIRDYCNTPWKTVVSTAGIALLIFTIIQTVCSIIQVLQNK